MSMMEENDLAIEEAVKAFLNNVLDIIEKGELENDTDNVDVIVRELLDAMTEQVSNAIEEQCEPEKRSNNSKDIYSIIDEHTDDSTSMRGNTEQIKADLDVKTEDHMKVNLKSKDQTKLYAKAKEHTEAAVSTEGQNDVLLSNFSKLALYSVEVKRGKVKIGHGEGLSKEEKDELKREAKELFDYVGILKKQTLAEQKKASGQRKGVRAGIRRFFQKFCCCGSKTDE